MGRPRGQTHQQQQRQNRAQGSHIATHRQDPNFLALNPMSLGEAMVSVSKYQRALSNAHAAEIAKTASDGPDGPWSKGQFQRLVYTVCIPARHVDASTGLLTLGAVIDSLDSGEVVSVVRDADGNVVSKVSRVVKGADIRAHVIFVLALNWADAGLLATTGADDERVKAAQQCLERSQAAFEKGKDLFEYAFAEEMTDPRFEVHAPHPVHLEHVLEHSGSGSRLVQLRLHVVFMSREKDVFDATGDAWLRLARVLQRSWAREITMVGDGGCVPGEFAPGSEEYDRWNDPYSQVARVNKDTAQKITQYKRVMDADKKQRAQLTELNREIPKLQNKILDMVGEMERSQAEHDTGQDGLTDEAFQLKQQGLVNQYRSLQITLDKMGESRRQLENAHNLDLALPAEVADQALNPEGMPPEQLEKARHLSFGLNWDNEPAERSRNFRSLMYGWEHELYRSGIMQLHYARSGLTAPELDPYLRHMRDGAFLRFSPPRLDEEEGAALAREANADAMDVDTAEREFSETLRPGKSTPLYAFAKLTGVDPTLTRIAYPPGVLTHGMHSSLLNWMPADATPHSGIGFAYFNLLPGYNPPTVESYRSKPCGSTLKKEYESLAARLQVDMNTYDTAPELNAALLVKALDTRPDLLDPRYVTAYCEEKKKLTRLYAAWMGYPDPAMVEEISPIMTHPARIFCVLVHDGMRGDSKHHMFGLTTQCHAATTTRDHRGGKECASAHFQDACGDHGDLGGSIENAHASQTRFAIRNEEAEGRDRGDERHDSGGAFDRRGDYESV